MNSSSIGPATVKASGGTYPKNAKFERAKLTHLGLSPNATVKLFRFDKTRFVEVDMITGATITEGGRGKPNKITVSGISEQARQDIANGSEEDYTVTLDIDITGCEDCG